MLALFTSQFLLPSAASTPCASRSAVPRLGPAQVLDVRGNESSDERVAIVGLGARAQHRRHRVPSGPPAGGLKGQVVDVVTAS
jgi:hypothetical protein